MLHVLVQVHELHAAVEHNVALVESQVARIALNAPQLLWAAAIVDLHEQLQINRLGVVLLRLLKRAELPFQADIGGGLHEVVENAEDVELGHIWQILLNNVNHLFE